MTPRACSIQNACAAVQTCPSYTPTTALRAQNKRRRTGAKHVSFKPTATVRNCLHINNYTDDEVDACWYNKTEAKVSRDDIRHTVNVLSKTPNKQDDDETSLVFCRRGAECKTLANTTRRQKLRMASWYAVLATQEATSTNRVSKDVLIAHAYKTISASAQQIAYDTGMKDQMEVVSTMMTSRR